MGTLHFARPAPFDGLVPDELPGSARTWTYASGVAELAVAAGLAVPATRRAAGWAAAGLFVAVFPGNLNMVRLWWDRPSPTITRNFGTPSSSRCIHPHADRGLTTREGARLQSFPDTYRFTGTRIRKNLQIGNAVPPLLAEAIGRELFRARVRA